jgi:hypothetical protein
MAKSKKKVKASVDAEPTIIKNQFDKGIARSLPNLDQQALEAAIGEIVNYLKQNLPYRNLMLLCKELSYYTIFSVSVLTTPEGAAKQIADFISTDTFIRNNIGAIKLVEDSGNYVEIWVGEYHFGLFPCDSFIVPI